MADLQKQAPLFCLVPEPPSQKPLLIRTRALGTAVLLRAQTLCFTLGSLQPERARPLFSHVVFMETKIERPCRRSRLLVKGSGKEKWNFNFFADTAETLGNGRENTCFRWRRGAGTWKKKKRSQKVKQIRISSWRQNFYFCFFTLRVSRFSYRWG